MNISTRKSLWVIIILFVFITVDFVSAQTLPADMTTTDTTTPTMPVGPSISSVSVKNITDTSAEVDVSSDEMVQGYVEYGTSEQYGMSTPLSSEFSATPSFVLSNLSPETLYHYRVVVVDSSGAAAVTGDETFTTLKTPVATPAPAPEPEPAPNEPVATTTTTTTATSTPSSPTITYPTISNVAVSTSTSSASASWMTSKPAVSDIQYGTTTSYGSSIGKNQTFDMTHNRTISNLAPGTLYHFRIITTDGDGNMVIGKNRTFTTAANPSSPVTPPVTSTTTPAKNSSDILAKIAELGSRVSVSQGGGGLPVAPSRPILLNVTPLDSQVVFDWRKDRGVKNGTIHTLIVKKQGTDLVRSRIDGDIIYDGPSTTFTDTNVVNGIEYHYALYSYGAFGRFTPPSNFKVIPQGDKEEVDVPAVNVQEENTPSLALARDLFRGKQGSDVTQLQTFLSENGYYPEALITGYFGSLTQQAVMRFQRLNNIFPVAGYVGSVTREVLGR